MSLNDGSDSTAFPEACTWIGTAFTGMKIIRKSPTQFGRAMKQLNVELILAHSPQARVSHRECVHCVIGAPVFS